MLRIHRSIAQRNRQALVALTAVVLSPALFAGCSDSAAMSGKPISRPSLPVTLASSAEFGIVVSGSGSSDRIIKLRNDSEKVAQISRWTTSCECLTIQPRTIMLAPQESVFVRLRYDTNKEPGFVGDLLVSVEGWDLQERVAEWSVPVSVTSPESLRHLDAPVNHASGEPK